MVCFTPWNAFSTRKYPLNQISMLLLSLAAIPVRANIQLSTVNNFSAGFGEMISHRLVSLGFKVVSGCLTQNGIDQIKSTVSDSDSKKERTNLHERSIWQ